MGLIVKLFILNYGFMVDISPSQNFKTKRLCNIRRLGMVVRGKKKNKPNVWKYRQKYWKAEATGLLRV